MELTTTVVLIMTVTVMRHSGSTDHMWELCINNYYKLDMTLSLQSYDPTSIKIISMK